MAFGLGEALSIGGSIAGGLFGDDANEDAANAIGASNEQIQRMIKEQQGSNDKAYAPYRSVGGMANNRLAQFLGLDIYGDAASRGYGAGDLVEVDNHGNFKPNEALMAISPEYRNAFNKWEQWHQSTYGTNANLDKDSNESSAEAGIAQFMGGNGAFDKLNAAAKARSDAFKSDPSFGSLLAKFSQNDLDNDVVYNTGLEFGLNEGVKGLNRRAASGGSYDSGATLKALTRYANDYGTTKADGAYNRFMNDKGTTYGFLSGQQGVGLNATDRNQSLNTGLVGQAVGANQNAASQQAQYGVQGAAALNNGIMGGIGNYLYSQRLGSGGGGVGTPGINGAASYPGYTYGNSSIPWYA
jgi:hypothetical protein